MARGDITHSPGKGKKISTFPYDVEQEVDGKVISRKVEIEVYMQSKYGHSDTSPKPVVATQFYLVSGEHKEWGTDLNACLKAMRSKLDRQYRIKWERWLLVRVDPARIYGGDGAGCQLSWKDVERGVTLDGDVLLREYNIHGDFRNRWEISPWPEQFRDKDGKVVSCIPATEANEKALETFAERLRELTKALADFVAPEQILETLALISSGDLKLLGSAK